MIKKITEIQKIANVEYLNKNLISITFNEETKVEWVGSMLINEDKFELFINDWFKTCSELENIQDIWFYLTRLIYNSFITNHIMIDGNKRMYKYLTQELNKVVEYKDLE